MRRPDPGELTPCDATYQRRPGDNVRGCAEGIGTG